MVYEATKNKAMHLVLPGAALLRFLISAIMFFSFAYAALLQNPISAFCAAATICIGAGMLAFISHYQKDKSSFYISESIDVEDDGLVLTNLVYPEGIRIGFDETEACVASKFPKSLMFEGTFRYLDEEIGSVLFFDLYDGAFDDIKDRAAAYGIEVVQVKKPVFPKAEVAFEEQPEQDHEEKS